MSCTLSKFIKNDTVLSRISKSNSDINKLISENKNFEYFCYKCFKLMNEDFANVDYKLYENQIIVLMIIKYYFML